MTDPFETHRVLRDLACLLYAMDQGRDPFWCVTSLWREVEDGSVLLQTMSGWRIEIVKRNGRYRSVTSAVTPSGLRLREADIEPTWLHALEREDWPYPYRDIDLFRPTSRRFRHARHELPEDRVAAMVAWLKDGFVDAVSVTREIRDLARVAAVVAKGAGLLASDWWNGHLRSR